MNTIMAQADNPEGAGVVEFEGLKIYPDVCTLCRPFDDQTQMRIRMETDAVLLILHHIQTNRIRMLVSSVHAAEVSAIREARERIDLQVLIEKFGQTLEGDHRTIRDRAEALVKLRFGPADAAHVAFAEAANVTFVSCDDRLLKKVRKFIPQMDALNPVEFCMREALR